MELLKPKRKEMVKVEYEVLKPTRLIFDLYSKYTNGNGNSLYAKTANGKYSSSVADSQIPSNSSKYVTIYPIDTTVEGNDGSIHFHYAKWKDIYGDAIYETSNGNGNNKSWFNDYADEEEIAAYLSKILNKEALDKKGLIYGMGHAVYSISDPRERVFKGFVEQLANEKGRGDDMLLYNNVEKIAPILIAEQRKIFKGVSPNIDFYSGFVYDMLNIPRELYTPLFAIARIVGWSTHRLEELITTDKIIRPAYKSLMEPKDYIAREER